MRFFPPLFVFLIISTIGHSQMIENGHTLYGHEWIKAERTYFKITIDEDHIYKLSFTELVNAGFPEHELIGSQLVLVNRGRQVSLYVSQSGQFDREDFLLFYGEKYRGQLDKFLYSDPITQQLNPDHSMYTDNNSYFLSWNNGSDNIRYEKIKNVIDIQNLPPQERFYQHEEKRVFTNHHFKPTHNGRDFIRYSSYDEGEGYGNDVQNQTIVSFTIDQVYSQGIRPKVNARYATSSSNHFIETKLGNLILNKYANQGYGVNDFEFTFNFEHLSNEMDIEIVGLAGDKDRHSLSSLSLTYPRRFDFQGKSQFTFKLSPSFIPRYLEIENFDFGKSNPLLFDLANNQLIVGDIENGLVKFVLPASISERRLLLINEETEINKVGDLFRLEHELDLENIGDYLIISNKDLYWDEDGNNWVQAYADYRTTQVGGAYQPSIVNVAELYDLFAYGIQDHSIAIKNFINYLLDQGKQIKSIFLIGKGLEYPILRNSKNHEGRIKSFVPTYGSPGGDNLLAAKKFNSIPEIPIGRLAVQSSEEIKNYLAKVIAFENPMNYSDTDDLLWRKKILHLSGGSADIQELLFGYLNDMKSIIENNRFGGDVFTFRKTTADLLQTSQTDKIIDKIDDGVSIITFFGHAAVGTFDFSLEDPSRYNNRGKNPVIFSLGCHSGNVHSEGVGLSEDFVLEKDNGAIAFVASSGTAYINPQYSSGINFYSNIGNDLKAKNLGEVIKSSLLQITSKGSIENITLAQQLTIHGDPALKFKMSNGPDYVSPYESFALQPNLINSTQDSFELSFEILNRGSHRDEKLDIIIEHVLPDGSIYSSVQQTLDAPGFSKIMTIQLPNPGAAASGKNEIRLIIDPDNASAEYPSEIAEFNNHILNPSGSRSFEFLILDNQAKPTYPAEFGIFNEDVIKVLASSDNGLVELGDYVLEMDTTELFNSSLLTREMVSIDNSHQSWEPDIAHINGVVYYWRLAPLVLEEEVRHWKQSSFIYLPGERKGWNQSHYFQWSKNNYVRLFKDSLSRQLSFDNRTWDIRVKNELFDPQDFWVFVNGTPWASLNPRQLAPAISVFIWDTKDILFENNGQDFGSIQFSKDAFLYRMKTPADRKNLAALLDAAPYGSRIFMHTILRDEKSTLHIEDWAKDKEIIGLDFFEVMRSYGAQKFDQLKQKGTVPYTFIFDKGIGPVAEDIANSIFETIDLSSVGKTYWDSGSMTSKTIGPVRRFMRLQWSEKKQSTDLSSLLILGHHQSGRIDTLREIINDYDVNLTFIHPDQYPQIHMEYQTNDVVQKTPSQLIYWRVFYQDLPDITFDLSSAKPVDVDTISFDNFDLNFGIQNLSGEDIDNFRIKYTFLNDDNKETVFYSDPISLVGNENRSVNFIPETFLPNGNYRLTVHLNPEENPNENSFENNVGVLQFFVTGDKREPILEVTANGEFIAENGLIPTNSEFIVTLTHPGSRFLLNDPDVFDIELYYPNGDKITFDKEHFEFEGAKSKINNMSTVLFNPVLGQIGEYKLVVKVKDVLNNAFEPIDYEVSFGVNNQSAIRDVTIFPNPMTTFAQIDLKLTGADLPTNFAIYIFDVSGKKVGSISRSAFDNIKTGQDKRSHLWRLSSSHGLNLSSGTYLLQIEGQRASEEVNLDRKIVVVR